jgi:hypothetical protein
MNKELRDGLVEVIKMNVCAGMSLEFNSISELLITWYENSKEKIDYEDITYRGIDLEISYGYTMDDNGKIIEETDFITIREDLEEQIQDINEMYEKGLVE